MPHPSTTTEPNRDRFSIAAIEDDNCRHIAALAGRRSLTTSQRLMVRR